MFPLINSEAELSQFTIGNEGEVMNVRCRELAQTCCGVLIFSVGTSAAFRKYRS
jgi:hypothetical protein